MYTGTKQCIHLRIASSVFRSRSSRSAFWEASSATPACSVATLRAESGCSDGDMSRHGGGDSGGTPVTPDPPSLTPVSGLPQWAKEGWEVV